MHKNDDKIDFTSKYGYKTSKNWNIASLVNFKSQFTKGYNYPNDSTVISNFLAPAYILNLPSIGPKIPTAGVPTTCAMCHGPVLEGNGEAPPLTGEFIPDWAGISLADLFEKIQTTMPLFAPGTLNSTDTADILAFILQSNHFPAGAKELEAGDSLRMISFDVSKPLPKAVSLGSSAMVASGNTAMLFFCTAKDVAGTVTGRKRRRSRGPQIVPAMSNAAKPVAKAT